MISLYEFLVKDKKKIGGYKAVDLDLPSGLKWANMNVGAKNPEDYGLLFQFARTDGYKYNDNNNKFLSDEDYDSTSGTVYHKLDKIVQSDDAAHINMKDNWRLPTVDEVDELIKYTNNEWIELNGVNGQKITSKKDDSKWIFIPAAGTYNNREEEFYAEQKHGYLWTSITSNYVGDGFSITIDDSGIHKRASRKCMGKSIRGVQ